jgi:Na+/phosphate symporter
MATSLPKLTPEGLRNGVLEMCGHAVEMLQLARDVFQRYSVGGLQDLSDIGRHLHHHEKRLTDRVAMQLREAPTSLGSSEQLAFLPAALERIGDSVESVARCIEALHREDIPISERGHLEILGLFDRSTELLDSLASAIRAGRPTIVGQIREAGEKLQTYCDEITVYHQDRLIRGVCKPRASSVFLAMLDSFREIERYVRRMTVQIEKACASP